MLDAIEFWYLECEIFSVHCVVILEESFCIGTYSSNVVIDIKLPACVTETKRFSDR